MAKKPDGYCVRTFLAKPGLASTASLVCFDGPSPWCKGQDYRFVEVSSCEDKARLHQLEASESDQDYIDKITRFRDGLTAYIQALQEKEAKKKPKVIPDKIPTPTVTEPPEWEPPVNPRPRRRSN